MSQSIAVAIEGPDADRALQEFLAIPGILGSAQPVRGERVMRDGGALVVIGAIVGIVGGVASIVTAILDWRDRWKQARDTARLSVVIEDAKGNRLLLDRATPEQITAVLETLAS